MITGFNESRTQLPGLPAGKVTECEVISVPLGYAVTKDGDVIGADGLPFQGCVFQEHLDIADAIKRKQGLR